MHVALARNPGSGRSAVQGSGHRDPVRTRYRMAPLGCVRADPVGVAERFDGEPAGQVADQAPVLDRRESRHVLQALRDGCWIGERIGQPCDILPQRVERGDEQRRGVSNVATFERHNLGHERRIGGQLGCSTAARVIGTIGEMRRAPGAWSTRLVVLVVVTASATAGCGVTRGDDSQDLLMIIPNSPGGGYDQTGRAVVQVMEEADISGGSFTVNNVVGAGGAAATTTLVGQAGDEHTMMTAGLGVVGSTYSFASEYTLQDATPLAQLMSEPEGVLVPGDSPFRTIDDLVSAWEADPGSLAIGGGSSPGGPDHLFPMELAAEVGLDPNDVNYVTYDGGGPLTSALLGEKIDVGFSGLAEFIGQVESGELRVLAVSGEERYPDGVFADIPTLTESGIDLVFLNWRGVLAPPEISTSDGGAHRIPGGDARQSGVAGRARRVRLDRRLQDRRRVR